jgi:hypothetical protein
MPVCLLLSDGEQLIWLIQQEVGVDVPSKRIKLEKLTRGGILIHSVSKYPYSLPFQMTSYPMYSRRLGLIPSRSIKLRKSTRVGILTPLYTVTHIQMASYTARGCALTYPVRGLNLRN